MLRTIKNRLLRLRYGDPVIVVSGLPRSGTSMLMNMLTAGGLKAVTDKHREADTDNPRGYFEDERVKDLATANDKSWLRGARGKAIKIISHLLTELPDDNYYRIVFMRRNLQEVIDSQNIMLERRGENNPVEDSKAIEHYKRHLINVRVLARMRNNIEMLEVNYQNAIDHPAATAAAVNQFAGGELDENRMAGVVDASLYRNRRS